MSIKHEGISIRTKKYDNVKDDPLYVAWVQSDKIYRSVLKRYVYEYQKRLEEAKGKIQTEVGKLFAPENEIASNALSESFRAYCDFYKEHPPCPMEETQ